MGGRKSLAETRPEVVELAHKLRKPTRSGKQRSLHEISAELAARGFVAEKTGQDHWHKIKKARQRLVLCRLMVDIMRTVHDLLDGSRKARLI